MRKHSFAAIILAFIIMIPLAFAEITINTGDSQDTISEHTFVVNKYITYSSQSQFIGQAITIVPIKTEAAVDECQSANFSFSLTNYGLDTETSDIN